MDQIPQDKNPNVVQDKLGSKEKPVKVLPDFKIKHKDPSVQIIDNKKRDKPHCKMTATDS